MTLLDKPQQVSQTSTASSPPLAVEQVEPQRHRWTPDDVYKMLKAGILVEGRGCELIDGELFDMSSQYNPHVAATSRINRLLVAAFDESYWLTVQSTVRLPRGDMPEPDFAIRPGPVSGDNDVHPLPLLVIEVSDSTLLYDRTVKAGMYAANQVADYWVVNLLDRQIEIHRNPVPDATRRHGFRYAAIDTFPSGTKVSPLALPGVSFDVDRMLP